MEMRAPNKQDSLNKDTVTGHNFKLTVTAIISSITVLGNSVVRYAFSNSPDMRNFNAGNVITISGCDNPLNDGQFTIKALNLDSFTIDILNASGVTDADGGGTVDLSIYGHGMHSYVTNTVDVEVTNTPTVSLPLPTTTPTQVRKTVGTSSVKIAVLASKMTNRKILKFQPVTVTSGSKFFVGDSTVTSSGATMGLEVFAGALYEFADDSDWYIISDSVGQQFVVVEQ